MEIVFKAIYGDEEKIVNVSAPAGMNGDIWHVTIDNYHQGVILFFDDQPTRWYFNERSQLTTTDIEYLIELIEANGKERK